MATPRRPPLNRSIAALAVALALGQAPASAQQVNQFPRHGGFLIALAGHGVQIEATWPMQRVLRVYVYDANLQPLPDERVRALTGRVVIGDGSWPLAFSNRNNCLEARIPTQAKPPQVAVHLRFAPGEDEVGSAFVFGGYSDERNVISFELPPTKIPRNLRDLLTAIRTDDRDARGLVTGRSFTAVYVPAVRVRDRLLALEKYESKLPAADRAHAQAMRLAAVRAAWLLHIAGDLGDPSQAQSAMETLSAAVNDVVDAFGAASR